MAYNNRIIAWEQTAADATGGGFAKVFAKSSP